nr:TraB domain-containing protein [Tanacetum cinerariifolium]
GKRQGGQGFCGRATVFERLAVEDMSASNADQIWNTLACVMKDATKDSLGVASARTHSTHRESWWFCEEDIDRAKERYKAAKREAKIAVAKTKDKAYEDLYKNMDSKEGVNEIYKIVIARERRRRDIRNVKYIKDEEGRTIVREEDIGTRWGEYFSSLFNETPSEESRPEGSGEVGRSSSPAHFDCYYSRINHEEMRAALHKMGRNKAVGPDQIPIEAWRYLGDEGVKWLTCLFNKIFSSAKMPDE